MWFKETSVQDNPVSGLTLQGKASEFVAAFEITGFETIPAGLFIFSRGVRSLDKWFPAKKQPWTKKALPPDTMTVSMKSSSLILIRTFSMKMKHPAFICYYPIEQ